MTRKRSRTFFILQRTVFRWNRIVSRLPRGCGNYGGTMTDALKTVLPVKQKKKMEEHKRCGARRSSGGGENLLAEYEREHSTARARLLEALLEAGELDWAVITGKLAVSSSVIRALEEQGVLRSSVKRSTAILSDI